MKKEKKEKSILSLIAKNTTSAVGGYALDKLSDATSGIRKRLDPRNIARQMAGPGLLGDVAEGLTSGAMKATGFGAKKLFGLVSKKKKDPRYTTVSNGPIRPLKLGDSVADILGKMYNFMLKTDQVYKLNGEIEQSFRQEQIDEDERRHKALVKAIKDFTKKYKKDDTKEKKEKGGFLDTILDGLKLWALELLADLAAFAARVASLLGRSLLPAAVAGTRMLGSNRPATKTEDQNKQNKKIKSKINEVKKETAKTAKKETAKTAKKETAKTAKKVSGNSKQNRSQRRTAARQRTPAKLTKRAAKNIGDDSNVFYGFDPKANLYFFKELVKNAIDWRNKNKSDYEPYRDEISKMVNGYDEFVAKQPFRADEEFETEIEKLPEYYIDPKSPKKVPDPYLDVNAPPVFFDPINKVIKEIPGMKEVLKDQQKINQEKNTVIPTNKPIPTQQKLDTSSTSGENTQVAVNNITKNIGGKPSRVLSTNSAKQRNSDLDRFLSNSSVVV